MRHLLLCVGFSMLAFALAALLAIGFTELLQFVLLRWGEWPAFMLVVMAIAAYFGFWGFVFTYRRPAPAQEPSHDH